MKYADWLQAQLSLYGITLYELEKRTGMDHSHLARIKKGLSSPSAYTAELIAREGLCIKDERQIEASVLLAVGYRSRISEVERIAS
jgi:transcriptional regulator with XRE-family HTH domain